MFLQPSICWGGVAEGGGCTVVTSQIYGNPNHSAGGLFSVESSNFILQFFLDSGTSTSFIIQKWRFNNHFHCHFFLWKNRKLFQFFKIESFPVLYNCKLCILGLKNDGMTSEDFTITELLKQDILVIDRLKVLFVQKADFPFVQIMILWDWGTARLPLHHISFDKLGLRPKNHFFFLQTALSNQ